MPPWAALSSIVPWPPGARLSDQEDTPSSREGDIEALAAQAQAIEEQLEAIQARIGRIKGVPRRAARVAVADPRSCAGCGVCQQVCPLGAISVGQVARVDGTRCTGCGRCVAECPRGALRLQEA